MEKMICNLNFLFEESSGTKSLFVLLRRLLPVLQSGGLAIIDKIDNELHPHMLPVILRAFKFEHTNPKMLKLFYFAILRNFEST